MVEKPMPDTVEESMVDIMRIQQERVDDDAKKKLEPEAGESAFERSKRFEAEDRAREAAERLRIEAIRQSLK